MPYSLPMREASEVARLIRLLPHVGKYMGNVAIADCCVMQSRLATCS